jgi:hypothetical protein
MRGIFGASEAKAEIGGANATDHMPAIPRRMSLLVIFTYDGDDRLTSIIYPMGTHEDCTAARCALRTVKRTRYAEPTTSGAERLDSAPKNTDWLTALPPVPPM